MNITMENFKTAKYDVFSIFDDRWGLCTAGTPREYNTMTIGWGTMGTIWGPPKKGKADHYRIYPGKPPDASDSAEGDEFTVCFFPEKYRKDLGILGSKSGNDVPDKISLTSLTPKMLGNAVGFEEAELTFVCKKIYAVRMEKEDLPEFTRDTLYKDGDLHYLYMGEIEDVFGMIEE